MSKVTCLSVDRGRFLKTNREVTWISGKRPCLYKSDKSQSIVYKPSVCLCVKSGVELLRSCGINILVVVSDIPAL